MKRIKLFSDAIGLRLRNNYAIGLKGRKCSSILFGILIQNNRLYIGFYLTYCFELIRIHPNRFN